MQGFKSNEALSALRDWLANERRLGCGHVAVSAPVCGDAAVVRPAAPAPRGAPRPSAGRRAEAPEEGGQSPGERLRLLDEREVRGCMRCELHAGRTQTVFGVGHATPEIVFVGEGPGADEDREGVPFVGRAGQLLTRMIAAMSLTRDQVYICNVVKCRPPDNRTPTDAEMSACSGFLFEQLRILRPKVIVALGRPAAHTLLATTIPIGKLRGRFYDFPPPGLSAFGLPEARLMPTFHPAYLLRAPEEKGKAWEDLKEVMRYLGIPIPSR